MSNDFEVDFNISEPPDDASALGSLNRDAMKLAQRASKAEARCVELEERLAKHAVRASSLGAMKEEATKAWVRIGELEREVAELARKNENLEEQCIELKRDLRTARGEAMTLRDAHGYKCFFSWEPAASVNKKD